MELRLSAEARGAHWQATFPPFSSGEGGVSLSSLVEIAREHEPFLVFGPSDSLVVSRVSARLLPAQATPLVGMAQARAGTAEITTSIAADYQPLDAVLERLFGASPVHDNCDLIQVSMLPRPEPYFFEALVDFPGRLDDHEARWMLGLYPGATESPLDVLRALSDQLPEAEQIAGARLLNFRVFRVQSSTALYSADRVYVDAEDRVRIDPLGHTALAPGEKRLSGDLFENSARAPVPLALAEFSDWQFLFLPMQAGDDLARATREKLQSPRCAISWFTAVPPPEV